MTDLLLGIDLGTSAVKTLVTDENGRTLAAAGIEYGIDHPRPGFAEQDPAAWWRGVVAAVRTVTTQVDPNAIAAVGLSGQMHGAVFLDAQQRPLRPAVIWPDQRSREQVDQITARVGAKRLIELTGSPLATGFLAATVRWVQQHEPGLWRQVARVLLPKDYVRWRLSGEFATDPSDGSGALLLDVGRRTWSPELLAVLDIDAAQLPEVRSSTALGGRLQAATAAELGLPAGLPVAVGAADTACSMLGAGAVEQGTLLLTLSTGGQLVAPIDRVAVDPAGRIHTFCGALSPDAGLCGWYQMGAILSAGMALRWLRDQVLGFTGEDAYERMMALAAAAPAGADGVLFLPYLAGERTPHMDPSARALFSGLSLQHGQKELVRAVLEGVTLACYDAFQVLVSLDVQATNIILAGGGARGDLWRQLVADVFGMPVLPLQTSDQSATGAALLAGAAVGMFEPAAASCCWPAYAATVEPQPGVHARYAALFERFRQAYAIYTH